MEPFNLSVWDGRFDFIVDQITIDSRRIHGSNSLFIALKGKQDGHHYVVKAALAGCRYAIVQKDWAHLDLPKTIHLIRVEDPLKALQEIASAYRQLFKIPFIGIAGSYGKTMLKDLLQSILNKKYRVAASPESFNSQIGVPLSLLTITHQHQMAIIETAFSHPNEMDSLASMIHPTHTLLTQVGNKHLATMGNLETVAKESAVLLQKTAASGWILRPQTELLDRHIFSASQYFWNVSSQDLPHARFVSTLEEGKVAFQIEFPNKEVYSGHIKEGGAYALDLINMAIKAAWLMQVSSKEMMEALENYRPEPMRTEIWKSSTGVTFINDAYFSDPQSVDIALKHFDLTASNNRRIFVLNGIRCKEDSHNHYRRIAHSLAQTRLDRLILIGEQPYESLKSHLKEIGSTAVIDEIKTLEEAYQRLRLEAVPNDAILIKGESKECVSDIMKAFNDGVTHNHYIINLDAIRNNIEVIKQKLPPETRLMVIVKALAYGTDEMRMARFLKSCGVDIIGVSQTDEGVSLRREGIDSNIFVIHAPPYEASKIVKWDLEVAISDETFLEAIGKAATETRKKVRLHLHVNTGMSRLGCRPEEALKLAKQITQHEYLTLEGLMTHFAASEDPSQDAFTNHQALILTSIAHELQEHGINPPWKHAANSSGVLRFTFPQFNMVRVGLAVYGLHGSEATRQKHHLKMAFSLVSRIVGLNHCKQGETVSYGRNYTIAKNEQRIAVLPIGYFDGLHRNYSGKGFTIIRGKKAQMVGNITMDYMMVDVTDIPNAAIGDPVLLFGEDEFGHYISPEEFAFQVDSIPHELITCLGPRIQRIFVYEEKEDRNYLEGHYDCLQSSAPIIDKN